MKSRIAEAYRLSIAIKIGDLEWLWTA